MYVCMYPRRHLLRPHTHIYVCTQFAQSPVTIQASQPIYSTYALAAERCLVRTVRRTVNRTRPGLSRSPSGDSLHRYVWHPVHVCIDGPICFRRRVDVDRAFLCSCACGACMLKYIAVCTFRRVVCAGSVVSGSAGTSTPTPVPRGRRRTCNSPPY